MNEDEATRMLAHLGERVPVGPAPVDVTLEQAKGSWRRRRAIQVVSAAAAVAVVAVGAFFVQPSIGGSGNSATEPTASPSGLAVPAGTRLVGINGIAVAVPEEWSTNDTHCGQALSDTVDFNDTTAQRACLVRGSENFSRLRVAPLSSEWGWQWANPMNGKPFNLQGVVAKRVPSRCKEGQSITGAICSGRLIIPTKDAVLYVTAPDKEVVDAVLDSASRIPKGYTAVPDLTGLYWDSEVKPLVASVGLLWENRCPDDADCDLLPIEATDPAAGSVVPVGTTVSAIASPPRHPEKDPKDTELGPKDYIGQQVNDATTALQGMGYDVSWRFLTPTDGKAFGTIAEVRLPSQAEVTLLVWPPPDCPDGRSPLHIPSGDCSDNNQPIDISPYVGQPAQFTREQLIALGAGRVQVRLSEFTKERCCKPSAWRPTDIVSEIQPEGVTKVRPDGLVLQGTKLVLHVRPPS